MKKIVMILGLTLACALTKAQVYFCSTGGLLAEYEDAPDSVISIPLYRTPMPAQETGALSGVFSVSPTRKVRFSKGNLQYETATGLWEFAANQYDTVGGNIAQAKVDLFGYGTSGWGGSGATAYLPTSISTEEADYYAEYAGATLSSLTGYMAHQDWGIHNPIQNGGNQAGLWRLLTHSEMRHVMFYRWTPFAYAYVNGVLGVVLFPDNWDEATNPNSFKVHPAYQYDKNWKQTSSLSEAEITEILTRYNHDTLMAHAELLITCETRDLVERQEGDNGEWYYPALEEYNVSPEEWLAYEQLGCVFLPFVIGRAHPENRVRNYGNLMIEQFYCIYWTSTDASALSLYYETPQDYKPSPISQARMSYTSLCVGGCVRLVQDY